MQHHLQLKCLSCSPLISLLLLIPKSQVKLQLLLRGCGIELERVLKWRKRIRLCPSRCGNQKKLKWCKMSLNQRWTCKMKVCKVFYLNNKSILKLGLWKKWLSKWTCKMKVWLVCYLKHPSILNLKMVKMYKNI